MVGRPANILGLALLLLGSSACSDREQPPLLGPGGVATITWRFPPFTWQANVTKFTPDLEAKPGGRWSLDFAASVDLRAHAPRYGEFTQLIVAVAGDRVYDEAGVHQSGRASDAVSSNFTTTGVPVEYFDGWPRLASLHGSHGSPFEGIKTFDLTGPDDIARVHRLEGRVEVKLPANTPVGTYRPRLHIFARVNGLPDPVHLAAFADNWREASIESLPLVAVGAPARPHMLWSILSQVHYRGQAGLLPDEARGKVGLVPRSGFLRRFIIKPGQYELSPSLPGVFTYQHMPRISGGDAVIPEVEPTYLRYNTARARCKVTGPDGKTEAFPARAVNLRDDGADRQGGELLARMTSTGTYKVKLEGEITDRFHRTYTGGGTYTVNVAYPLSFSTSCKPGMSFIAGSSYPAKVNINPPFPARVTVEVHYFPASDPTREQTWRATGRANGFGHFDPEDPPPLKFTEPGEYISHVLAEYRDRQGRLWMGQQSSTGVIAEDQPDIQLHGTRTFPYGLKVGRPHNGGVKRFTDRPDPTTSFMPTSPTVLPDPYVPYDPRDTLFIPTGGFDENLVEPHFSMAARDPALTRRLQQAHTVRSFLVPPMYQPSLGKWRYLRDVVQLSTDSGGWFPADRDNVDELPVLPISRNAWHPFAFPGDNLVDAYTIMGVVRPGLPVMTSVHQRDAIGLYWLASPNPLGNHFNNGPNGDLPGDLYRVQAGVVIKDRTTGKNHYDAYSAAIAVAPPSGGATAIVPPGERALVTAGARSYRLFLAIDTHFALEQGERLGMGGMVFPAVPAEVTWTITTPSGEILVSRGKANRLGSVKGDLAPHANEAGLYRIKAEVRHGDLRGDVIFTPDGSYWICVLPRERTRLLETTLPAMTKVDAFEGLDIPIAWPRRLKDVRLHWGLIMPGQVLDQGETTGKEGRYSYPFSPVQLAVQFPNFDVRDFTSGRWSLADTVVFQFFLEGKEPDGARVHDSLRLVLRQDRLYNYAALMHAAPGAGHPGR